MPIHPIPPALAQRSLATAARRLSTLAPGAVPPAREPFRFESIISPTEMAADYSKRWGRTVGKGEIQQFTSTRIQMLSAELTRREGARMAQIVGLHPPESVAITRGSVDTSGLAPGACGSTHAANMADPQASPGDVAWDLSMPTELRPGASRGSDSDSPEHVCTQMAALGRRGMVLGRTCLLREPFEHERAALEQLQAGWDCRLYTEQHWTRAVEAAGYDKSVCEADTACLQALGSQHAYYSDYNMQQKDTLKIACDLARAGLLGFFRGAAMRGDD